MAGYSLEMAQWAEAFSLENAPPEVVANARLRVLDIVGVMIASYEHETVTATRLAIADSDAGGKGATAVMGSEPLSLAGAAMVNGVSSAVLEFDDTHTVSNIHPSGVIVSAALPIAQSLGLSGKAFLEAVIVGSELLCRIGLVSPIRMHEVGLHPTGVYGAFGATYAASRLKGLNAGQMANAVGTAGSLAAGSIASFEDGTSTKTLHVGFAASAAIRATALAAHGVSGPGRIFEGKFGWFKSHFQTKPDFRFPIMTDRLGEHWEVLNIATKLYPCAYTLMPFITAALDIRQQHALDLDAIEEVRCEIMPRSFQTVCEPLEEKRRPLTSWHGRISLQHTVAEALVLGRFDKAAYSTDSLSNPAINALADKVVHIADPIAAADITRSRGVVELRFKNGETLRHTVEDMLGTRTNPASEADYVAKFMANIDGVISSSSAEQLVENILQLDAADTLPQGLLQTLSK
jgi:2-methylcitrate dehydratase PrpD